MLSGLNFFWDGCPAGHIAQSPLDKGQRGESEQQAGARSNEREWNQRWQGTGHSLSHPPWSWGRTWVWFPRSRHKPQNIRGFYSLHWISCNVEDGGDLVGPQNLLRISECLVSIFLFRHQLSRVETPFLSWPFYLLVFSSLIMSGHVFLKFILFAFIEIFEICKSISFTKFGNFSAIIFSNTFSAPIAFSFPSGTPITWVLDLQYCPSGPCSVSFLSSKGIMYIDPPSGILTLYSAISLLLWSSPTNFF